MSDQTPRELFGELLKARITRTAQGYRDMATKLDGLAAEVDRIGTNGTAVAMGLASRAVHEAMWGAANASVDAIIMAAADYDNNVGL